MVGARTLALVVVICGALIAVQSMTGSFYQHELSAANTGARDDKFSVLLQDKYRALLHREKNVLNSGTGGLDWGNHRFLAHASLEQQSYVDNTNKKASVAAMEVEIDFVLSEIMCRSCILSPLEIYACFLDQSMR